MTSAPRHKVIVLESIHPDGIAILEESCEVHQLSGPNDGSLASLLPTADALVVRSTRVSASMIAAARSLKVIGRHGAGTDNIDLLAAARHGVSVVNTPHSNTDSVAEYVITVTLMLLKRIDEAAGKLRSGAFLAEFGSMPGQVDRMGLVGKSASGCSMGLVGAGAIGRAVAVRALALGMRVYAYDPFISPEATSLGIEFLPDLSSLLASVDVVSLHAPGGTSNRSLIGASELAQMRPGSIIVNAARGELVDVDALAAALHSGQLAGAAVDVFDPEPPDVEGALFKAPNLIATPHMAAMTQDALVRMAVDVARAVTHALGNASGKQDLGNG